MASSNLVFEFSRRWKEIGARLFPQPTPEQREAIFMLEQNMRDLEDAWPSGASFSGTIILSSQDVFIDTGVLAPGGGYSGYSALSVTAPSDIISGTYAARCWIYVSAYADGSYFTPQVFQYVVNILRDGAWHGGRAHVKIPDVQKTFDGEIRQPSDASVGYVRYDMSPGQTVSFTPQIFVGGEAPTWDIAFNISMVVELSIIPA